MGTSKSKLLLKSLSGSTFFGDWLRLLDGSQIPSSTCLPRRGHGRSRADQRSSGKAHVHGGRFHKWPLYAIYSATRFFFPRVALNKAANACA